LLRNLVRGSSGRAFNSDLKANVTTSIYFYPDASVSCDPRDRQPRSREIWHPLLVLEVLSPSTADYDQGEKFDLYCASDSLGEYVLIHSQQISVEVRSRDQDGTWTTRTYSASQNVDLHSLAAVIPIETFYEDVELD